MDGHVLEPQARADAARVEHLAEVPGEAEAADVGAGVHADLLHRGGGRRVQRRRLVGRGAHLVLADDAVLEGAGQHADAQPLRQHERVARLRPAVVDDVGRTREAGHGEPVLRLLVLDRVAAGHLGARLLHLVEAAAQDLGEHVVAELRRPGHEVHRRQRPGAHGVHVRQRVGRGDRAEQVRVVDDGREEVDRLHQAEVVGHLRDGGVVPRLEETRELAFGGGELIEDGLQVARTHLGRSTALRRVLRQSDLVGHGAKLTAGVTRPAGRGAAAAADAAAPSRRGSRTTVVSSRHGGRRPSADARSTAAAAGPRGPAAPAPQAPRRRARRPRSSSSSCSR